MLVRLTSSLLVAIVTAAACTSSQRAAAPPPASTARDEAAPAVAGVPGACDPRAASRPVPRSPGRGDRVVIATAGASTLAYVANEDDGAIHTVDVGAKREVAVTPLPGSPSALVAFADGRIAVALRDRNEVLVVEPPLEAARPLRTLCRAQVASEPVGLATFVTGAEPRRERLAVTSGFGHTLTLLDQHDLSRDELISLPRDPRAVFAQGDKLFVSHVASAEVSVIDAATGVVTSIHLLGQRAAPDPRFRARERRGDGPDPLRGGQVYALASDTRGRLFAPMVTVDPGEPKPTSAYGGSDRSIKPFVGVIDVASTEHLPIATPGPTTDSRVCTLPRAAAATADGRLFVACLGIDEVLELDARANDAASLVRRRVRVASGPMGIALAGDRAVVLSQFDREVTVFSIGARDEPLARVPLSRPAGARDEVFERGRKIFHDSFDTRVSTDGRACASCHPDGRDDGNTWSTPDGPRQTITLAGRIDASGPYGWFGEHPTLRSHLHHTVLRLGGQGFERKDEADLAALERYLVSMKAPARDTTIDAARVAAGSALFHEAKQGCGACHGGGGSDRALHDVGSGTYQERRSAFDTPSLQLVGGSGPYFHDGRYATLDALLDATDGRMGHARHLDADQRASLVAYMRSLGPLPPPELPDARVFSPPPDVAPLRTGPRSAFEASVLASNPEAPTFEARALDLASVPTVAIAPPVRWDTRRAGPQGGARAEDPFVWDHGCAAIPHHTAAFLQLGWHSAGMTRALERCVDAPGPNGFHYWVELQAQTIDPRDDGTLHVVLERGFMRHADREVWITQRIEADAAPIFGGLGYALRATCADCVAGERDRLFFVTTGEGWHMDALFSVSSMSIEAGRSSTFVSAAPPWRIDASAAAIGRPIATESAPQRPRGWVLRADSVRGKRDAAPRVVVARAACDAERSSSSSGSGCG